MIIFVLNLYNATLELSDVGDRKLYTEAVKGINEADIPTTWDTTNIDAALKRLPIPAKTLNILSENNVTREKVKAYSELVWVDRTYDANISKYFKIFPNLLIKHATLNADRNKMRIKHVIMGKKLWASLTLSLQLKILWNDNMYTVGGSEEYDRTILC